MRDIALFALVFGSIPFILRKPWIGILMWSFISYANPHRQCWGPAYSFPFAQVVAITLLASLFINRPKFNIKFTPIFVFWAIFMVWMAFTSIMAVYPESAFNQLEKVYKIQLITFLTIALIDDRQKVNALVITLCASIGLYSVKGGIFTISTAGAFRVWGPAGSFIEDNNALAVAILMTVPLAIYLAGIANDKRVKYLIFAGIGLSVLSAIGSQSRGAFLTVVAMAGFLALKSRNKIAYGVLGVASLPLMFAFMPDSWHERMSTIRTYDEDASAMGRLNAWEYAYNIANARLTGGGFDSWSRATFARYAPNPEDVHAAHSIWFGVLGDHGWPGLLCFVTIFVLAWRELGKVIRSTRKVPEALWMGDLARMLQVCLVAYFVGATFLSLAYFDLPWHFVALAIILKRLQSEQGALARSPERSEWQGLRA